MPLDNPQKKAIMEWKRERKVEKVQEQAKTRAPWYRFFVPRKDVDMTRGNIVVHLITFAIPLLIGNIFQQLYNTVDTWVVGNYVGSEAFAAVGTVGPIINTLIGFFLGLSSGAGVVISQYYGAKNEEQVQCAVHTAIVMTAILGVLFTGVGILFVPMMLGLMKMPENVFPEASAYLTIYFAGVIGLMLYNMGAGILRAIGDSQRPFYYLVVSALLNIFLDLLFVLRFDMGVSGVAYATIISQGVSAFLVIMHLFRSKASVRLHWNRMRLHWAMLKKICRVGLPAALQMAITAFSNIFVQGYINVFGDDCMGGWTAYLKTDQFIFMPMQSLALASTTFVGQNLGVNQVKRARRGADIALGIAAAFTVIVVIPVVIFAPALVNFLNPGAPAVIAYGAKFLRYLSPFYVLCCVNQVYAGALRGAGNSRAPMIAMLLSFVAFRQGYLYCVSRWFPGSVMPLAMGYPAGWFLCSLIMFFCYRFADLSGSRVVDDGESVTVGDAEECADESCEE